MTERFPRATRPLAREPGTVLRTMRAGSTVVVSEADSTGESIARVERTRADPSMDGRLGYELSTNTLDGAPTTFVVDGEGLDESGRCRVLRDATHAVDRLFAEMHGRIGDYPPGTEPVWARLRGTAFFPGGSGLWRPTDSDRLPPMPERGVMVIGQDYYTKAGYLEFLRTGQELETQTWRELRKLFVESSLSEERCFFTNAWMGLRSEGRATGRYAGARDRGFTRRCAAFLEHQIAVQRPRLILTLGGSVLRMLTTISPLLTERWGKRPTLSSVDSRNAGVVRDVAFPGAGAIDAWVVALVHPCMRNSNVHRRRHLVGNALLSGNDAEIAMLGEALVEIG